MNKFINTKPVTCSKGRKVPFAVTRHILRIGIRPLSVCFSEALNFATWFANVISSGEGIRTGKVGGIDLIIANILSENVAKR